MNRSLLGSQNSCHNQKFLRETLLESTDIFFRNFKILEKQLQPGKRILPAEPICHKSWHMMSQMKHFFFLM